MVRKRFSSVSSGTGKRSSSIKRADKTVPSRNNSLSRSATKSNNENGTNTTKHHRKQPGQKTIQMPVRLNKRLRKLERDRHIQSIAAHTVADNTTAQETLSANWNLLHKVVTDDKEKVNTDHKKKRRRHSSSNLQNNKKKSKTENSVRNQDKSDENAVSDKESGNDIDSIIKSINDGENAGNMKDEHKLAWFENVDPVLVDDDLIGPESPCQPSDAEVSDNEDAVEVDMDEEDDFIVTKESNQEQAERLKEKKRIDELSMNAVALDCEMVGVGVGGCSSALGRVSIVDRRGDVLYDKYAEPVEPVTDYRTRYSGIRPENLKDAPPFSEVQAEVAKLIKGRIVVGHALKNDFGVLLLSHPQQLIRDTSLYRPFMERYRRAAPSLKNLSRDFLGLVIQEGEHDSVTDARVAMRLYYLNRVKWERNIANGTRGHFSKSMLAAKPTSSGHGRSQRRRTGNKNKRKIGKASHSKSRRK